MNNFFYDYSGVGCSLSEVENPNVVLLASMQDSHGNTLELFYGNHAVYVKTTYNYDRLPSVEGFHGVNDFYDGHPIEEHFEEAINLRLI